MSPEGSSATHGKLHTHTHIHTLTRERRDLDGGEMVIRDREGHSHGESKQWRRRCNKNRIERINRHNFRKRPEKRITGQTNLRDRWKMLEGKQQEKQTVNGL